MVIGIIGAGASGMAAAIEAAKNPENQVLLFERQARVGRKLLATGNGRCNLTNRNAKGTSYNGDAPEFAAAALEVYSVEDTLQWFEQLGLVTVSETSGRVYPYSDQANSVLDVLRFALEKPNIRLLAGAEVSRVRKNGDTFAVECDSESYQCDRLVIACGGLAGTKLGGSMSGYKLLRSFGHRVTKLRPALVQLKSGWKGCTALKGVRANCRAEILRDGQIHRSSFGEIQFTDYGISGPVVFEISRDACHGDGQWSCRLDFLPEYSPEVLLRELNRRRASSWLAQDLLTGILHNRLGRVLVAAAGIDGQKKATELSDVQLQEICGVIKAFEISLTESLGMENAQVTAGGAATEEFDPLTLQSRLVPGLYACGEVLDIDGECGGYNLQWAWSSGRLAGSSAGRSIL